MSKTRTIILEPVQGERGPEAPLADLLRRLQDLAGTTLAIGGEFTVRADRVKIGELPGTPTPCGKCGGTGRFDYDQGKGEEDCRACDGLGRKPGRPEPIGETLGWIIQWRDLPQLADEPLTARLMDEVLGEEQPALEEGPIDPFERTMPAPAPVSDAPEADDEPDEEEE